MGGCWGSKGINHVPGIMSLDSQPDQLAGGKTDGAVPLRDIFFSVPESHCRVNNGIANTRGGTARFASHDKEYAGVKCLKCKNELKMKLFKKKKHAK